jgi:hypothetical protein
MIIVRKTVGRGIAPKIFQSLYPYEIVLGGNTSYYTEEGIRELQNKLNQVLK